MLARTTYSGVGYTHQGWLTDDQAHFLVDDELDSGLRYFHWYRINNHGITLLIKKCQELVYVL